MAADPQSSSQEGAALDDDALIHQAMGFSSFADHGSKKRKYQHHADHAVTTTAAAGASAQSQPGLGHALTAGVQWEHRSGGRGRGGGFRGNRGRGGGGGGGNQGQPWWEGYYDILSNENPWEELERASGLEANGTWLRRGERRDRVRAGGEGVDNLREEPAGIRHL